MKKLAFLFLSLLFVSSVFGGTIDPNTSDQKYVEFAREFPFVVKLCGDYSDDTKFCGSAVLIKPNTILTAAHVVKGCKAAYIKTSDDKKVCIPTIVYHQKFDDNKFGYNDIAVGFLENNVDLDFYPELYVDRDEINKQCTMSGYGITGNFLTGATILTDSNKRAGSNMIDGIDRGMLICSPSRDSGRTQLEFLIASGDSGGGLFIGHRIAGIHSCVISSGKHSPRSAYGDTSGHTRISDHAEWINKTIAEQNK